MIVQMGRASVSHMKGPVFNSCGLYVRKGTSNAPLPHKVRRPVLTLEKKLSTTTFFSQSIETILEHQVLEI